MVALARVSLNQTQMNLFTLCGGRCLVAHPTLLVLLGYQVSNIESDAAMVASCVKRVTLLLSFR
jgi:hypothetical protein